MSVPSLMVVVENPNDGAASCSILPVSVAPVANSSRVLTTSTGASESSAVRPSPRVPIVTS